VTVVLQKGLTGSWNCTMIDDDNDIQSNLVALLAYTRREHFHEPVQARPQLINQLAVPPPKPRATNHRPHFSPTVKTLPTLHPSSYCNIHPGMTVESPGRTEFDGYFDADIPFAGENVWFVLGLEAAPEGVSSVIEM